jgi:hypothetical protein
VQSVSLLSLLAYPNTDAAQSTQEAQTRVLTDDSGRLRTAWVAELPAGGPGLPGGRP